ncbi:hypothetical protein H206_05378 [Candidatus Electrothrix aarhusensis]|uniref:Uncharacterized protein n=1 Tax=Candidatus Electrothrix aarhusensis TaxID=1859131 RepID=A0A3S3RAF0_9BACT|nr:hypothetical protein H206_05378 [Candidatus Electrothrix aarhusensis]
MRHHSDIRHRQLERTAALLLDNQAGYGPIHLIGEEAFGSHRNQSQDVVEVIADCRGGSPWPPGLIRADTGICPYLLFIIGKRVDTGGYPYGYPGVLKGFLRDITQHLVQFHVHRGATVLLIMDDETEIAGDLAQDLATHLFSLADGLEFFDIFRADQKAVTLLEFSHVDLQHRHGRVADPDFADLDPTAGMLHQLLEHIGWAARA